LIRHPFGGCLKRSNSESLRRLIDIEMNGHLSKIVRYQGSNDESGFLSDKRKALAGVAELWEKEAPFQTPDFLKSKDQLWFQEWKAIHEKNLELIKAALAECRMQNGQPAASVALSDAFRDGFYVKGLFQEGFYKETASYYHNVNNDHLSIGRKGLSSPGKVESLLNPLKW
jgi:hypothetical protein